MAPFEPKTDSKEFEVANPEKSAQRSGTASAMAADITIRLWRQDQTGAASALTWNTESVLVYMIADLVAASHGRIPAETPAMIAHFDNANQALVAAKRVQLAILEFVTCKPGDCLGAAVLIHPSIRAGFSAGMAQNSLRLVEPGQIILAEAVARAFQDFPGLELRPVAALTTGGAEHAGLAEFVWATPEQTAKLRESARARTTAPTAGPAVGATMIVNTPVPDGPDTAGPATQNLSERAVEDGFTPTRDRAFEEELAELQEHRSFVTRTRVIVGVVAIILLGAAVALFYPSGGSKVPKRTPLVQTEEPQNLQTPSQQPVQTQPNPPVQQNVDSQPKDQLVADQSVVNKPPVTKPTPKVKDQGKGTEQQSKDKHNAKKPEDKTIQGFEGDSTYDGMTQRDIPRLLQWARSDAGNGRYEKAAREYRVVLQLQPNNPDAKEGLRRIQLAQQGDQ